MAAKTGFVTAFGAVFGIVAAIVLLNLLFCGGCAMLGVGTAIVTEPPPPPAPVVTPDPAPSSAPAVDPVPVETPAAEPVPPTEQPAPDPAAEAAKRLQLAKAMLDVNPDAGRRRLREVVETYPGTEAAAEAETLLAK